MKKKYINKKILLLITGEEWRKKYKRLIKN